MSSRLNLRKLEVMFGEFHLNIDLQLDLGCVGIFGPSGSGKTTLLEVIAGLRRSRSGQVELDGEVLSDSKSQHWIRPHLRQIGYVPQDLALFPHLNVRGNIAYGVPKPSRGKDAGEKPDLEAIAEVLELGRFSPVAPIRFGWRTPARRRGPGFGRPAAIASTRRTVDRT